MPMKKVMKIPISEFFCDFFKLIPNREYYEYDKTYLVFS